MDCHGCQKILIRGVQNYRQILFLLLGQGGCLSNNLSFLFFELFK